MLPYKPVYWINSDVATELIARDYKIFSANARSCLERVLRPELPFPRLAVQGLLDRRGNTGHHRAGSAILHDSLDSRVVAPIRQRRPIGTTPRKTFPAGRYGRVPL